MIFLKTVRGRHLRALPSICSKTLSLTPLISYDSSDFSLIASIFRRPFSLSSQFAKAPEKNTQKRSEPLSVFYKGAVGLTERIDNSDPEAEDNSGNANLKEKLKNLEEEVRILNKNRGEMGKTLKPLSEKRDTTVGEERKGVLSGLFSSKKKKKPIDYGHEDPMVYKELSYDMQVFTRHLYNQGYFQDVSFMPKFELDLSCFEISYARKYLKFATINFADDHREITKWLSASDLKNIALFGCPSPWKRTVKAAKHMRRFFGIEEVKVCQKCPLKESCKHASKDFKKHSSKLDLASVTRVLIVYATESLPQQLVVPEEINTSVSRLLKEMVNLSQTKS